MLSRSDKITESLKEWESLILKLSEYAEVQKSDKKVEIYQTIYKIQNETFKLKSLINSLKKRPQDKAGLKETLILELFEKIKEEIDGDKYFKELRFNTAKFQERLDRESVDQSFWETGKKLEELSDQSIEPIAREVNKLIKEVDSSIESYSKWSCVHLEEQSQSFKKRFSKIINRLQYFKDKTEAWLNRLLEKPEQDFNDSKMNLTKAYKSLLKAWGEIQQIKGV